MLDVDVIEDPGAAAAALDPIKSRLLSELTEPASAASLAGRVGMARQKVNYHLRGLEAHKLVRVAADRRWGGLTEHLYVATATSYVVSPAALGPAAADPARATDRLSASYLIAVAARVVHEVAALWRRATAAEKHLATLSIDWQILTHPLGLRAPAEGQRVTSPAGVPRLSGVVESVGAPEYPELLLRLDAPAPGIAHLFAMSMGGNTCVPVRMYFYGDQAAVVAGREEPLWQEWIRTISANR